MQSNQVKSLNYCRNRILGEQLGGGLKVGSDGDQQKDQDLGDGIEDPKLRERRSGRPRG